MFSVKLTVQGFVVLIGGLLLLPGCFAQVQAPQGLPSQQRTLSQQRDPIEVKECQGADDCATWVFVTKMGTGEWPSGEKASLVITNIDEHHIVIERADTSGPTAGLRSTYTGTIDDTGIGGTYNTDYHGKTESGRWYLVFPKNPDALPAQENLQITELENTDSQPVTWIFRGTTGSGNFRTDPPGGAWQPLVLEHFDNNSITVSRRDTVTSWRGSARYTGQINGTQIINGQVTYWDRNHKESHGIWHGVIGNGGISASVNQGQQSTITADDIVNGFRILKSAGDAWRAFQDRGNDPNP